MATSSDPSAPLLSRLLIALLRSLVSFLVIGAVAIAAFAMRKGYTSPTDIKYLIAENRMLLIGIFVVLVIWNCWRASAPKKRE